MRGESTPKCNCRSILVPNICKLARKRPENSGLSYAQFGPEVPSRRVGALIPKHLPFGSNSGRAPIGIYITSHHAFSLP